MSVNEQQTPKKAANSPADKKEIDASELLDGADGKLIFGRGNAQFVFGRGA